MDFYFDFISPYAYLAAMSMANSHQRMLSDYFCIEQAHPSSVQEQDAMKYNTAPIMKLLTTGAASVETNRSPPFQSAES